METRIFDPDAIHIKDYDYELPAEKIAQFPLADRDASKLLLYRQGNISDDLFYNIDKHLPGNSLLVFNDTKVIRARLYFRKPTGALIEIFCLEPVAPASEINAAFHQRSSSTWKCLAGNMKRWKSGTITKEVSSEGVAHQLSAELINNCGDGSFEVSFHWNPPEMTFSEILEMMGLIPLPPYIERPAESSDNDRYQTIYAVNEGSVAAPTAGLHFTAPVLERIKKKGIVTGRVTLHVGAGTFRPVTSGHIRDHVMHHEKIVVSRKIMEHLLNNPDQPLIAVGTTSARTLESLYWLGVKLIRNGSGAHPVVSQWDPYSAGRDRSITVQQSLEALLQYLDTRHLREYSGETQLMIVPGYTFRLLSGIITNFHIPQSTLLLLVAAMIGDDWRASYHHALTNGYRFLSYGDSCLFFNPRK